jgi:BlaI family transcriptional regulator, penicillinase repressor
MGQRSVAMGQKATERISDAELAVMEVLWADSPLTATDVAGRVVAQRDWSLATVKTLLSRLVAKQAIGHHLDGRRFLYTPLVERDAYVAGESRRLVDRFFGGKLMPLVAHLAQQEKLSDDDYAEIERLLRERKS